MTIICECETEMDLMEIQGGNDGVSYENYKCPKCGATLMGAYKDGDEED